MSRRGCLSFTLMLRRKGGIKAEAPCRARVASGEPTVAGGTASLRSSCMFVHDVFTIWRNSGIGFHGCRGFLSSCRREQTEAIPPADGPSGGATREKQKCPQDHANNCAREDCRPCEAGGHPTHCRKNKRKHSRIISSHPVMDGWMDLVPPVQRSMDGSIWPNSFDGWMDHFGW